MNAGEPVSLPVAGLTFPIEPIPLSTETIAILSSPWTGGMLGGRWSRGPDEASGMTLAELLGEIDEVLDE